MTIKTKNSRSECYTICDIIARNLERNLELSGIWMLNLISNRLLDVRFLFKLFCLKICKRYDFFNFNSIFIFHYSPSWRLHGKNVFFQISRSFDNSIYFSADHDSSYRSWTVIRKFHEIIQFQRYHVTWFMSEI